MKTLPTFKRVRLGSTRSTCPKPILFWSTTKVRYWYNQKTKRSNIGLIFELDWVLGKLQQVRSGQAYPTHSPPLHGSHTQGTKQTKRRNHENILHCMVCNPARRKKWVSISSSSSYLYLVKPFTLYGVLFFLNRLSSRFRRRHLRNVTISDRLLSFHMASEKRSWNRI